MCFTRPLNIVNRINTEQKTGCDREWRGIWLLREAWTTRSCLSRPAITHFQPAFARTGFHATKTAAKNLEERDRTWQRSIPCLSTVFDRFIMSSNILPWDTRATPKWWQERHIFTDYTVDSFIYWECISRPTMRKETTTTKRNLALYKSNPRTLPCVGLWRPVKY